MFAGKAGGLPRVEHLECALLGQGPALLLLDKAGKLAKDRHSSLSYNLKLRT
jgi:hypothetical protein